MGVLRELFDQLEVLLERPDHRLDAKLLEALCLVCAADDHSDVKGIVAGVREQFREDCASDVACVERLSTPSSRDEANRAHLSHQ